MCCVVEKFCLGGFKRRELGFKWEVSSFQWEGGIGRAFSPYGFFRPRVLGLRSWDSLTPGWYVSAPLAFPWWDQRAHRSFLFCMRRRGFRESLVPEFEFAADGTAFGEAVVLEMGVELVGWDWCEE